jgi:hypothetical protein
MSRASILTLSAIAVLVPSLLVPGEASARLNVLAVSHAPTVAPPSARPIPLTPQHAWQSRFTAAARQSGGIVGGLNSSAVPGLWSHGGSHRRIGVSGAMAGGPTVPPNPAGNGGNGGPGVMVVSGTGVAPGNSGSPHNPFSNTSLPTNIASNGGKGVLGALTNPPPNSASNQGNGSPGVRVVGGTGVAPSNSGTPGAVPPNPASNHGNGGPGVTVVGGTGAAPSNARNPPAPERPLGGTTFGPIVKFQNGQPFNPSNFVTTAPPAPQPPHLLGLPTNGDVTRDGQIGIKCYFEQPDAGATGGLSAHGLGSCTWTDRKLPCVVGPQHLKWRDDQDNVYPVNGIDLAPNTPGGAGWVCLPTDDPTDSRAFDPNLGYRCNMIDWDIHTGTCKKKLITNSDGSNQPCEMNRDTNGVEQTPDGHWFGWICVRPVPPVGSVWRGEACFMVLHVCWPMGVPCSLQSDDHTTIGVSSSGFAVKCEPASGHVDPCGKGGPGCPKLFSLEDRSWVIRPARDIAAIVEPPLRGGSAWTALTARV